jgi:transposase
MDTNPKKQRQHFYRDYASGQWSMSELCARYQISRPTGYKWVDRIEAEGLKAVEDRSRAPNRHPNRTPEHVEREILVLREKYGWGATKLTRVAWAFRELIDFILQNRELRDTTERLGDAPASECGS